MTWWKKMCAAESIILIQSTPTQSHHLITMNDKNDKLQLSKALTHSEKIKIHVR